jgi:hypothetical protein
VNATQTDVARGIYVDPRLGKRTFGDWAEQYLEGAHHMRASTRARNLRIVRVHLAPTFGHRSLAAVTPLEVRRFVDGLAKRLKPSTVRTVYAVLTGIFNAAVESELIVKSPCRGANLSGEQ